MKQTSTNNEVIKRLEIAEGRTLALLEEVEAMKKRLNIEEERTMDIWAQLDALRSHTADIVKTIGEICCLGTTAGYGYIKQRSDGTWDVVRRHTNGTFASGDNLRYTNYEAALEGLGRWIISSARMKEGSE